VLANWPHDDVRMIVLTDGERILGLGDLGADGMGIPVGKLSLYTACAGLHPTRCLPMTLDVGTNNADLLKDPLYIGLQRPRLRGEDYDRVVDKLIQAIRGRFPRAVLQFEDFATENAFRLLRRYRDHLCCFNDDIQGTAAVTLAGLISANRLTGRAPEDLRVLFLGAGEAGTGIADLIVSWLEEQGMREGEARHRCWLFDSKGLVVQERTDLAPHKLAYAHGHEGTDDFLQAIEMLRPHAIIGVSGTPGTFTRPVLEKMAELNPRPIVFALSNPTSKSECTARQAYTHTGGRAIFASGSPFPPVDFDGRTFVPGQGNNAYVFPGVGLGAVVAESSRITDPMFLAAAKTLAGEVLDSDLALGRVYPSLSRIREVSAKIARSVAEVAFEAGLTDRVRMGDLDQAIHEEVFEPIYPQYA
ncbi:MAG: NAD-dependent malic enzyme, partial [Acidobacteria bacterium]|nr:NAD-dependent malic enzyme [Acidobacteriota bacterium]